MEQVDKKEKNTVSVKEFSKHVSNYLFNEGLDVELNIMNYKEYKFNFENGKFEKTQKSLLPVINGLGNVNFDQRDKFRNFNLYLYSEYENEMSKNNQKMNFKIRYTPINRHYIAGDKIYQIDNLINYQSKEKINVEFKDNNYTLIIFTTPLHFNYNPDLIKKLQELDQNENIKIYLVFITDKIKNEEYEKVCDQFINHYKFQKLSYLIFNNLNEENLLQYKYLNLNFDLTDPSKICYFINKEGLILSDFVEFTDKKLKNIKLTITNSNDEFFIKNIQSNKRFNYRINNNELEKEKVSSKSISAEEAKIFISNVKFFNSNLKLKIKKNNFLIIQVRKYFDISKESEYYNEKVDKISILYALNKKYFSIYQMFMNKLEFEKNLIQNIFYNGIIVNHREKLCSTLKIIKDEIFEHDIDLDLISSKSLRIDYNYFYENGEVKKNYNLINSMNLNGVALNGENDQFNKFLKLNELENEITKDKKSPAYIFNDFLLIPRLSIGDNYVPLNMKHLSEVKELKFDTEQNKFLKLADNSNFVLIYYFFTSWSAPAISKLKELNNLSESEEFKNKVRIIGICIDSDFEELQENLIYNLFGNLDKISIEIYFSCTQIDKTFEIFQKLYRAHKTNNSLVIVDSKGIIRLIDNFSSISNFNEKLENAYNTIFDKNTIIVAKEKIQFPINMNNKITKDIALFYNNDLSNINYSHEFYAHVKSKITLDEGFKILNENINDIRIQSELRLTEDTKLQNFIEKEKLNCLIKRNQIILDTIDLNAFCDKINSSEDILCSICKEVINTSAIYYCHSCDNFTCIQCQPKHEHNLIMSRIGNKIKEYFTHIDTSRLGENLAYYGTLKSQNHPAGCNRCETLINNKARFICLNCLPGKVPLKTGYSDYCEDCIRKISDKWNVSENDRQDNKEASNKQIIPDFKNHDELNHIYLRLDFSVTYFDY